MADKSKAPSDGDKESKTQIRGVFVAVTGPAGGRWRAGRKFTPEPTLIDVSTLTEEEQEAIAKDPELRIARP
ncbi:hypothetical protein [Methylosinus sp. KRF6]|uniref:hypothetical protein n=1 Tax=Methylosinus sp. KRF6 TaxID=2846853 RepID=UPI001C0DD9B1|nr:hypothetical protein [Methylosinus sp. KRF6]MBU3890094.1 hypothetical protein [Methylosinus sp. KRF6]